MCHVWGTGEVPTGFWWEDLLERNDLEDVGLDGKRFSFFRVGSFPRSQLFLCILNLTILFFKAKVVSLRLIMRGE
jgi:hypothetical protein